MPASSNYRGEIDGLRAIAVIAVVLFHLKLPLFSGGFVGVDVFFVISGYLITRILWSDLKTTGRIRLSRFFVRRFRRLYPALLAALVFTFICSFFILVPFHLTSLSESLLYSLASFSNYLFWTQSGYFDADAYLKPLLHTWSLSAEWQFYIFWPFIVWLLFSVSSSRSIRPLILMLGLLIFTFAIAEMLLLLPTWFPGTGGFFKQLYKDGESNIYYLMPARMFEFAIGGTACFVNSAQIKKRFRSILFLSGIALCIFAILVFDHNTLFPSWAALIPCGGAFLIIVFRDNYFLGILDNPVFRFVGQISYSVYLYHWPIIVFWFYLDKDISALDYCVLLGLIGFFSILSYFFVEKRFRFASNPVEKSGARTLRIDATILVVSVVVTTGLAAHAIANSGWVWRSENTAELVGISDPTELHKKFYGGYEDPISNQQPISLILSGDSHAGHYTRGINALASEGKIGGWIKNTIRGCFHMPGLELFKKSGKKTGCEYAYGVLKDLGEKHPNATIVISYYWFKQLAQVSPANAPELTGISQKVLHEKMAEMFSEIGNRFLVIGMVPTTGHGELWSHSMRTKFAKYMLGDDESWKFSKPSKKIESFNRKLRDFVENAGHSFIDPVKFMCENGKCQNLNAEGKLLYSDGNHFSFAGSEHIVRAFETEFLKALKVNP